MDCNGRQKFGQVYGEQLRPYWLPSNQPSQPPVLVVQVPVPVRMENNFDPDQPTVIQKLKSRSQRNKDFNRRQTFLEKKSVCAILPFYELEGQDLSNEIQNGADDKQGSKLTLKLREAQELTALERKNVCSWLPGAGLSDKEFRKLFSRPASQSDLHVAVNNTLVSSLKLAEDRLLELQNKIVQLESSNISVKQHHFAE